MTSIKIRKIGPIAQVEFDLNKVNVFMGPQSSGKSTIAKICSQCIWCEKNYLLTGDEYDFYSGLLEFHRMDEGYFNSNSEISYESQWVTIKFKGSNKKTFFKKKKITKLYKNLKIEYIPAERNFAAAIPNLEKYSEGYDNIINFLKDWLSFKEIITKNGKYSSPLSSIDVIYKYDTNLKKDVLTLANNKQILLQRSSSGQQSIIPLLVVCEFMFTSLYEQRRISSSAEHSYIKGNLPVAMKADYEWVIKEESFPNKSNKAQDIRLLRETKEKIWNEIGISSDYGLSNVIIEEPEQNLFPETQKELIYHILNKVNDKNRDHQLILTTHSPFILYALNNCMLGGLVKDNIPLDELDNFQSKFSWIDPKLVSVWEIEDKTIRPIKNNETGTVSKHYFNGIMNDVMEEYFDLLTFLKK
jgi:energy-coupling factor transporter ATP-binding protein EcfA2